VKRVVIAGLASEYIQYITTPEEYGVQSYEGASTLFGRHSATFLQERLVELGQALVAGAAAPAPHEVDTSHGVTPDGPPYPPGADSATVAEQPPAAVQRLEQATFAWDGAPLGADKPLDRAFVTAQQRSGGRWTSFASDLGMQFMWRVDAGGRYRVQWEVPWSAPAGTYRFVVTASGYRLASRPFRVTPRTGLELERVAGGVRIRYPSARVDDDLTWRPAAASGGTIRYSHGGRTVTLRRKSATVFPLPHDATIAPGAARDRFGNSN
jgi:neutral ceramidase